MIKIKKAGILLGGLAGYLLLNRGIGEIRGCVHDVCDAIKWRAYYKYDQEGHCVAPGYCQYTRPIGDDQEVVVEQKDSRSNASKRASEGSLSDTLNDIISSCFNKEKGQEGASEGQTEASESEKQPSSGRYSFDGEISAETAQKFMDTVDQLRQEGMTDEEIAASIDIPEETLTANIRDCMKALNRSDTDSDQDIMDQAIANDLKEDRETDV